MASGSVHNHPSIPIKSPPANCPRFVFLTCCVFLFAVVALYFSTVMVSVDRSAPASYYSSFFLYSLPPSIDSRPPNSFIQPTINRPGLTLKSVPDYPIPGPYSAPQPAAAPSSSGELAQIAARQHSVNSSCDGKRVFMYDLPPEFNDDIVGDCKNKIAFWIDFCNHVLNDGFGKPSSGKKRSPSPDDGSKSASEEGEEVHWADWYETDPYMLEVIFRRRMLTYGCRTENPSEADAFFIPYYSGLDGLRYLYGQTRPKRSQHGRTLIRWLSENYGEFWRRNGGRDHFIVMGRTAWDFTVPLEMTEVSDGWGTSLAVLPEMRNVTALFLERRPKGRTEQAIPYPTAFHPRSVEPLRRWQRSLLEAESRRFLFAFVGAPRPSANPGDLGSIRQAALDQCLNSSRCSQLDCLKMDCFHNPLTIGRRLLQADFCLQPPGDSPTRRSTFDGILSGCIPVFFHVDSSYVQYTWHLPPPATGSGSAGGWRGTAEDYSVLIEPKDMWRIEEVLAAIPQARVAEMRRFIVNDVLPSVVYARGGSAGWRDAFDISIESFLRRAAGENI